MTQNDDITVEWQWTIVVKSFITLAPDCILDFNISSSKEVSFGLDKHTSLSKQTH